MTLFSVIEILQFGFPGLAFLLALFSYKLLAAEQKKEHPRNDQLQAINTYMKFSLILGVLTVSTPIIGHLLEDKPNPLWEAAVESMKNRKPLPLEFVKDQISTLTAAHNKRLESLYERRTQVEKSLEKTSSDSQTREINKTLRRVEQQIRDENREYDSKVSEFTRSL